MPPSTEQQLAALFRETGSAHHQAFAATKGEDPDWPTWYAEYLSPRLERVFGRPFDVAGLESNLRAADAERRRIAAAEPWAEYYARWFLLRVSR